MLDFSVISTLKSDVKTTLKFDDILISEKDKNKNVIAFFMDFASSHLQTSKFICFLLFYLIIFIIWIFLFWTCGLASYIRFIWIPLLLVYGHYRYIDFPGAGIVLERQDLTSVDVRFRRLRTTPRCQPVIRAIELR